MDTRTKIVTPEQAQAIARDLREQGVALNVVTGYFDVLQPALLEPLNPLAAAGTTTFAIVLDPPEPLQPGAARAELAAALRVINYVIPFAGSTAELHASGLLEALQPSKRIYEETMHEQSVERLIDELFRRHSLERARRPRH